ncbi:MAG TPA: methyltransferase domain-containing protein [Pyrinomonadaceae bacterium]|nr:methyltransferase domain-containing protein [Pyrinomonadaceae bacterium]
MKRHLLEILACPKCTDELRSSSNDENISEGSLTCVGCGEDFPVTNGIPRFVPQDNYASSFGYQWNLFRKVQLDSYNGTTLSADRLWNETGWTPDELSGKWVLDVGCGAGRFLDAVSRSDGEIVGIDISNAIDASQENLTDRENIHFVQASIYDLPFREGAFDRVYCIGVVQHTPDRDKTLRSIAAMVKPDGKVALTIYPRRPWTKLFSKYWLRPITKRMRKETLLKLIQGVMPVAFPITEVLFRIPLLGKAFMFIIPVANYVHEKQLNREQRYSWAVLDTFDMLSPAFDRPMTAAEALKPLEESGIEITRQRDSGLNLTGTRQRAFGGGPRI